MTPASLVVALVLKPGLVLTGALILAWLLRRRSAAARHAMWSGAICAVLLLPVLATVLPPLRMGTLADVALAPMIELAASNARRTSHEQIDGARSPRVMSVSVVRELDSSTRFREILVGVWAAVALILVSRRLVAEVLVRRLAARGRRPSFTLSARCDSIARARGIRQTVLVVSSNETPSPAVIGIFRPVVILPATAERWTDAETANVLVHELSHVARRDCAINLVADLTAALHWCNPMMYIAARRIRAEGEQACDDEVLRAGSEPDAYAMLLLAFARASRTARALPRAASAMARPSELEARVLAVLDSKMRRAPLRPSVVRALAGASIVFALPIAAASLSASVVPAAIQQLNGPEPDRRGDSLAAQSSERLPLTLDDGAINAAAQRALAGPDSALAATLLDAVRHPPNEAHSLVRDRAAWALSQTRGDRLMDPILEALDSSDWRVQAYAAWTAGVAGDRRAVPKLISLVQHPVWRLRAMAASVLVRLADARAADVMTLALTDEAWQVRMEAVTYIGALGDAAQRPLLRARLDDRHIGVRQAAARALNVP